MTAHKSQLINKDATTAGASGNKYIYCGRILFNKYAIAIKQPINNKIFKSKNQRYESSLGVINEINQLPNPITGGYSIAFVADRYGQVLFIKSRSPNNAGISV